MKAKTTPFSVILTPEQRDFYNQLAAERRRPVGFVIREELERAMRRALRRRLPAPAIGQTAA